MFQEKQLGQVRPGDGDTQIIYTSGSAITSIARLLVIANTGSVESSYNFFHDDDGTVATEDTALCYGVTIPSKSTKKFSGFMPTSGSGSYMVSSGSPYTNTFTLYGAEIS
jgi:hypothetical protein